MSPDERLGAIADRLMAVRSPALRTAMAMDVFGKAGVQILPMLSGGAAGLAAMRQQARALGLSMSGDTVKAAAQLNDALGPGLAVGEGPDAEHRRRDGSDGFRSGRADHVGHLLRQRGSCRRTSNWS